MTERSLLQIQILEKLGAPLIAAAGGGMASEGPQTAEKLASLMGRAIQTALALAKTMEIKDDDPQADSVKLSLAAIAASLLAGHYRSTGKLPEDNDVKRLSGALETILSYGDNFIVAAGRLQGMDPGPYPADEHQVGIQAINAMVPVVNAITAFPFGQPERKLVQEAGEKLMARAKTLRQALVPGADDAKGKVLELALLRGLASLYVASHEEGKLKIMAMDEAARNAAAQQNGGMLPMDSVWQTFELRAGALEILGRTAVPGAASAGSAGNGAGRAPAPVKPVETAAPVAAPPPAAPVAPPPAAAAPPADTGVPHNPMAFFKPGAKKQGDTEQGQG